MQALKSFIFQMQKKVSYTRYADDTAICAVNYEETMTVIYMYMYKLNDALGWKNVKPNDERKNVFAYTSKSTTTQLN